MNRRAGEMQDGDAIPVAIHDLDGAGGAQAEATAQSAGTVIAAKIGETLVPAPKLVQPDPLDLGTAIQVGSAMLAELGAYEKVAEQGKAILERRHPPEER